MVPNPTPRPRPWKRRLFDALYFTVGVPLIVLLIRLLASSLRLRLGTADTEIYHALLKEGRPVIWAFWHEDLFGVLTSFMKERKGQPAIMISRSHDGEKLARVIKSLGMDAVRGSSSRGAVRGLIELKRWLNEPGDDLRMAAMALDGPRGPRRKAKPGAVLVARQAGAVIIPVAFLPSRRWVFRSWDRTCLPKPFATLRPHLGRPVDPSVLDQSEAEISEELERTLNDLITEEPGD